MSAAASVLADNSTLSRLDRLFFRLESLLTLAGGFAIFLLVLLATVNILGRWIFSSPISGYVDWVEQAMAFIAFLGIAYTQRMGGHIRMDILVGKFRGRYLWFTELVTTLLMLAVTSVLIYGSYMHFWRAYTIGDSSLDINLPTWPAKLVVPIALTILAMRLLLQLWGYMRALKQGGDKPVAVPLVESAADVAAREASAVSGHDEEKTT
ncbi:TRAP transporter small permease subunit [Marinobacter salsuginis]|jgi:TRAP-type C4-dicarboxylate transport system permease small subunit|uniref:TRAP transporter small permease subunit n=1 Tax=Marinobacter salsuginis TaxID=418719 RepID=UPI000A67A261|nr:TRAP transporter small permease [Marinobacter salsuginis]|tara:strand:- start:1732 stop:2358 length:627 start_codon:yes stop_codon:yes gene_type:complete